MGSDDLHDDRGASTKARGDAAEAVATRFLISHGYTILGTQVRAGGVEIDVIARAPDEGVPTIVFVEVRARSDAQRGHALETIGPAKRRRLVKGATAWLVQQGLWERVAVRFDVIALTTDLSRLVDEGTQPTVGSSDNADLLWLKHAFEHND